MPIKFRPTAVTIARGTGKKSVTHHSMKVGIPTAVLNPIVEETDDLLASTR